MFAIAGCYNPATPASSTTSPQTTTVTATVAQSAYTTLYNKITDLGTQVNPAQLEYVWIDKNPQSQNPQTQVPLIEESYIKFNIPQIPAGASIEAAYLNINVTTYDASCTTCIKQLSKTWDTATIASTNEPDTNNDTTAAFQFTVVGSMSFNITSLVRSWVNGSAPNDGIRIVPSNFSESSDRTTFLNNGTTPNITITYL